MQKNKKTNKQNKILSVVKEMLASQKSTKNKWHKMGYSLRSTEEVQVHTVKAATPNLCFPCPYVNVVWIGRPLLLLNHETMKV